MTWEGRFTFEVSSAAPDATPVWVDFTSRIRDAVAPMDLGIGRQDNLDQSLPAALTLVLENVDDALTYGNTTSPYPWWVPGLRCRLRETIAGVVMDRFTGFTQVPVEALAAAGLEQRITLTAVDRLGAMQNGRPFISTLAEYIRYAGGPSLVAFWPLNDPTNSLSGTVSLIAGVGGLLQVTRYNDTVVISQLTWASQSGPVGDDSSYVRFSPTASVVAASYAGAPRLARRDLNVALVAGQVVAILGWVYNPFEAAFPTGPGQVLVSHANSFADPTFQLSAGVPTGWSFFVSSSAGSTTLTVPAARSDGWSLVGMFLNVTSGAVALYVDGQSATGSVGGASTGALQEIALDTHVNGSWGLVQMYVGPPETLNQSFFAAQYQMGLSGFERQSTGDRIRTAAQYAGIPNAEFANTIDPGSSVMQRAQMAGKTALDLMREAETTEQGLLYVDGSGNLCFADRRTIYNI